LKNSVSVCSRKKNILKALRKDVDALHALGPHLESLAATL